MPTLSDATLLQRCAVLVAALVDEDRNGEHLAQMDPDLRRELLTVRSDLCRADLLPGLPEHRK